MSRKLFIYNDLEFREELKASFVFDVDPCLGTRS